MRQHLHTVNQHLRVALLGIVAVFVCLFSTPSYADRGICLNTTQRINASSGMPAHMLSSIALTESGRWDKRLKAKVAWPWTVTSGGPGEYFATKAQAIAKVRELKRKGVTNIDVGCMQINLRYHPKAFTSLAEAFNPQANVRYAAKFLSNLKTQWGSWREAIRRYHSANTTRGYAYERRVAQNKSILTGKKTTVAFAGRSLPLSQSVKQRPRKDMTAAAKAKREKARAEANAWRKRKLAEYMARRAARRDG